MIKTLCFDMDGCIADLYGVENWLSKLHTEDASPYIDAKPLVNMNSLARVLNHAKREGWTIKIISWTSKQGTPYYNAKVTQAKKEWLMQHLASVVFDEINIIEYGTPKSFYGDGGYLFDDEQHNRDDWNGVKAFDEKNIISTIQKLIKEG